VLFVLTQDPDAGVKQRAGASLERMPDTVMRGALEGALHPAVLAWCAEAFRDRADRLEAIALNVLTDGTTIAFPPSLPHKRLVDIISNNQERMLRCPDIVEALGTNPLTGRSVIDRILAFLGLEGGQHETPDELEEDFSSPTVPVTDEEAKAALAALL